MKKEIQKYRQKYIDINFINMICENFERKNVLTNDKLFHFADGFFIDICGKGVLQLSRLIDTAISDSGQLPNEIIAEINNSNDPFTSMKLRTGFILHNWNLEDETKNYDFNQIPPVKYEDIQLIYNYRFTFIYKYELTIEESLDKSSFDKQIHDMSEEIYQFVNYLVNSLNFRHKAAKQFLFEKYYYKKQLVGNANKNFFNDYTVNTGHIAEDYSNLLTIKRYLSYGKKDSKEYSINTKYIENDSENKYLPLLESVLEDILDKINHDFYSNAEMNPIIDVMDKLPYPNNELKNKIDNKGYGVSIKETLNKFMSDKKIFRLLIVLGVIIVIVLFFILINHIVPINFFD